MEIENEGKIMINDETNTVPSYVVIALYMEKVKRVKHEKLKNSIKKICEYLSEKNVIVPVNFIYYGEILYSDIFNGDINFLISCGAIVKENNLYRFIKNYTWNVSHDTIKILNNVLNKVI